MSSNLSCGFCLKAGIFGRKAAHFVKECPLLAKTECRYCHKLGHTKSHCQVLKEKNSRKKTMNYARYRSSRNPSNLNTWVKQPMMQRAYHVQQKTIVEKTSAHSGRFSLLEENDDDDEPVFTHSIALPKPNDARLAIQGCWSKPMTLKTDEEVKEMLAEKQKPKEKEPEVEAKVEENTQDILKKLAQEYQGIGNWGDEIDSEDDDEELSEEETEYDFMGRPTTDNSAW